MPLGAQLVPKVTPKSLQSAPKMEIGASILETFLATMQFCIRYAIYYVFITFCRSQVVRFATIFQRKLVLATGLQQKASRYRFFVIFMQKDAKMGSQTEGA